LAEIKKRLADSVHFVPDAGDGLIWHQRRKATSDQIASTTPNGHAPCKNP